MDVIDVELFPSLGRAALILAANLKPEQALDAMPDAVVMRLERPLGPELSYLGVFLEWFFNFFGSGSIRVATSAAISDRCRAPCCTASLDAIATEFQTAARHS